MGNTFAKKKSNETKEIQIDDSVDSITITSNYFPKNGYIVNQNRLEPIARVLLLGVYDDTNPLSIFRGMRYIIKEIWQLALQFNKNHYSPYIQMKDNPLIGIDRNNYTARSQNHGKAIAFKQLISPQICYWPYGQNVVDYKNLKFPAPLKKEININMMPLKMYPQEEKLQQQLPKKLYGYIDYVRAVIQADPDQKEKICFLTIHESYVAKGRTQRRPGLHIEFPGAEDGVGGEAQWFHGWGGGYYQQDGLYIASSVSNTCCVWNCRIIGSSVIGNLGDMQHLKCLMPKHEKYMLEKDKLYWITDRTPHEALPMEKAGWRQFFRLVSSKLGVWYEFHSTKNPIGIVPDQQITTILKGNKFKGK